MKKKIVALLLAVALALSLASCSQASRVSANLSKEADNFNDYRQLTVIDCITGDVLFQMSGFMSITADTADNQLEIIVETDDGEYKKHFVGLSDNVTYIVEDVTSADVSNYQYVLNFNPNMWLPVTVETID